MNLFHVTREKVLPSIQSLGIEPKFATGRLRASWYVDEQRVIWSMAHVSARWGVSVDLLYACEVNVREEQVKRWSRAGVYYCMHPLFVDTIWGYERFLAPEGWPVG